MNARKGPAVGSRHHPGTTGMKRVSIAFPDNILSTITSMASVRGASFASEVRRLVERALGDEPPWRQ